MNVAFFTNNYLPNPYGVSRSLESFRAEMERLGHTVFIFAPGWKGYEDKNPHVFRYPSVDVTYKFRFPLPIPYSRDIHKILGNLKIDIIHAHHPNLLGSVARRWAKKKNVPLVFTWHTRYDQYAHFGTRFIGNWFAHRMIRRAVWFSDESNAVVAPSKSMEMQMRSWGVYQKHTCVIPTGIDPKEVTLQNKFDARVSFGFKPEDRVLVTVSRFTQEKNVEFLFRSVLSVLKRYDNARFLAVGGGDLLLKLKQMAIEHRMEKRTLFLGESERGDVWKALSTGDVFVYASRSETQGITVAEAMYAGLPVVAVRAPGVEDAVMDKVSGFLVPEREEVFSQSVGVLLSDENRRREFSVRGREVIERAFLIGPCTQRLIELYERTRNGYRV